MKNHCCICLVGVGLQLALSANCPAATELVLHTNHAYSLSRTRNVAGLLPRELARQAVLIAARDEVGMLTCDKTLRESPRTENPLSLLMAATLDGGSQLTMRLYKSGPLEPNEELPPPEEAIWSLTVDFPAARQKHFDAMVQALGEASRGELAALLKKLGGGAVEKAPAGDNADVDAADVDDLLLQVDVVSQFAAVRRLQQFAGDISSATVLQGLARGYANLGLLSETSWDATTQALQARALLYSERLTHRHADDPLTPWAVGYAHALTGMHGRAIEIIEQAVGDEQASVLPDWTQVALPYSRFQVDVLENLAESDSLASDWATYLHTWAIYTTGEKRRLTDAGREAISTCPEATNLYFMMTYAQPIGIMRFASSAEISALLRTASVRIPRTPGLPDEVVEVAENPDRNQPPGVFWRDVTRALRRAKTVGEPSWGALATLMDDQAMRAASNSVYVNTGASTEQNLAHLNEFWAPFIAHHPSAAFVTVATQPHPLKPNKAQELAGELQFPDANVWIRTPLAALLGSGGGEGSIVYRTHRATIRDFSCQSLIVEMSGRKVTEHCFAGLMNELRDASPHAPMLLIREIQLAGLSKAEISDDTFARWEASAGFSSVAWKGIADAYRAIRRQDDAIRCYEKSIQLSPERESFETLADAYRQFKQPEKFVPTLERFLDVEDFGLGHSLIHNKIAGFLMEGDDFAAAKPHALKAAETYSTPGLTTAAFVCEMLGEQEEADRWYRALSTSYPSYSGVHWYMHRRRVGVDDLDEPRELALRSFGPRSRWHQRENWWQLAYHMLEQDHSESARAAESQAERAPDWYSLSMVMIAALNRGKDNQVEKTRQRISKLAYPGGKAGEDWLVRYADLIEEILSARPDQGQRLAVRVREYLALYPNADEYIGNASYLLGKLLRLKGFTPEAAECYQRTLDVSQTHSITWTLAKAELHDDDLAEFAAAHDGQPAEEAAAGEADDPSA